MTTRRRFLTNLAAATGAVVLMPAVSRSVYAQPTSAPTTTSQATGMPAVPFTKPDTWDPIAYNRARGNAGAIPESYLDDINGPDGVDSHLGKHLPYVQDAAELPAGHIAIMWGDPDKGHTRHPNAVRSDANNHEGHWYNWIRVRKATSEEAEEAESTYVEWPGETPDSTGAYAVLGEGDITDESGKNTIYIAALPSDVSSGDTIRIHAHCLTHGEYVDFLTVP